MICCSYFLQNATTWQNDSEKLSCCLKLMRPHNITARLVKFAHHVAYKKVVQRHTMFSTRQVLRLELQKLKNYFDHVWCENCCAGWWYANSYINSLLPCCLLISYTHKLLFIHQKRPWNRVRDQYSGVYPTPISKPEKLSGMLLLCAENFLQTYMKQLCTS